MITHGRLICIIIFLLGIIPILSPIYGQENLSQTVIFTKGTVNLDNVHLKIQIAQTQEQQVRGLMFQKQLPFDQGMLFIFGQEQVVGIWMMNMQFPLDIIWFDKNGNVLFIQKNASPCKSADTSVCPVVTGHEQLTKYVLEVTSGFVDKFNVTKNSKLDLTTLSSTQSNNTQSQVNDSSTVPEFSMEIIVLVLAMIPVIIVSRKQF